MAAGTVTKYNVFKHQLGLKKHDLSTDIIKAALLVSTYTPNYDTHVDFAVIDAWEHSAISTGYVTGGQALTSPTYVAGVLNAGNLVWTAGSAGILAKWLVFYNSSAGGTNDLIALVELESGGTVTVTEGNALTVDLHDTLGILNIA